jgi:predicted transcriptional regulator
MPKSHKSHKSQPKVKMSKNIKRSNNKKNKNSIKRRRNSKSKQSRKQTGGMPSCPGWGCCSGDNKTGGWQHNPGRAEYEVVALESEFDLNVKDVKEQINKMKTSAFTTKNTLNGLINTGIIKTIVDNQKMINNTLIDSQQTLNNKLNTIIDSIALTNFTESQKKTEPEEFSKLQRQLSNASTVTLHKQSIENIIFDMVINIIKKFITLYNNNGTAEDLLTNIIKYIVSESSDVKNSNNILINNFNPCMEDNIKNKLTKETDSHKKFEFVLNGLIGTKLIYKFDGAHNTNSNDSDTKDIKNKKMDRILTKIPYKNKFQNELKSFIDKLKTNDTTEITQDIIDNLLTAAKKIKEEEVNGVPVDDNEFGEFGGFDEAINSDGAAGSTSTSTGAGAGGAGAGATGVNGANTDDRRFYANGKLLGQENI